MNERLINTIKQRGKTMYVISKETGIPYATLQGLVSGKTDINKCFSETLLRLSLYLQTEIPDLMNPVHLLDGIQGTYRGIRYVWKYDPKNKMELHVTDRGQDRVIDSGSELNQVRFYESYCDTLTKALIDQYLESKEVEAMLYD